MSKGLVYLVLGVTMTVGGYLPALFGLGIFSGWSIFGTVLGLVVGVFIVIKMKDNL